MFFLFRDLLIRLGQVMVETNRLRYRTLNEAFGSLRDTVSVVLITHNLEIIKNADKIYVLSAGRIVDFGDYSELKNKSNI